MLVASIDGFEQVTFRSMALADLDLVMVNEEAAYPIPWTRAIFEQSMESKNHCVVMLYRGELIGHAVVSSVVDEFHLLNLCVNPAWQGQGLGRCMLQHLIKKARADELALFFLEVRVSNRSAIELYRSEGFNEVGLRPNYYPAEEGREDALLMTMQLQVDNFA